MTITEFSRVFVECIKQYNNGQLTAPKETIVRDLMAGVNNQERQAQGWIKYDCRSYADLIAGRRRSGREFKLHRKGVASGQQ